MDKIDENNTKYGKNKFTYQAKTVAYGMGDLTAWEQHLFDLMTSKISKSDPIEHRYFIAINDAVSYFGLNGGSAYQTVKRGMEDLANAFFNIYDENTQATTLIPIFEELKISPNDDYFSYIFNRKALPYLFHLRKNFYFLSLSTLRSMSSKNSLILLRIWCAEKTNDANTVLGGDLDSWRRAFQGKEYKKKPWNVSALIQAIRRSVKILDKKFGHRYRFEVITHRVGHRVNKCYVKIFGDNTTPYPILNKNTDVGGGLDMKFADDVNHNLNILKAIKEYNIPIQHSELNSEQVKIMPESLANCEF